ncbi:MULTISPECIES: SDR family oxidoreductase [Micromonospora]|uniref:SDR family oxidoreductase n=1 Tax=Micromonospora TaxID=1873 RepID=UPI00191C1B2C|nr:MULTISPECIES: NAD-dependent epimerase/dehydratase family protein [unclassified Micromonospora]MBM0224296.1 NAD-dependent epimerase/dehydratase family protein [Micromonospora sp. ATA51]
MPPVLVTGGTGTLGRHVVSRLRDAGCDLRVLTRRGRPAEDGVEFVTGDLTSGAGVDAAVGACRDDRPLRQQLPG